MNLTFEEFLALHNLLAEKESRIVRLEDTPLAFSRAKLAEDITRKINGYTPDQKREIEKEINDLANGR